MKEAFCTNEDRGMGIESYLKRRKSMANILTVYLFYEK